MDELTADRLRELLIYNPATGVFTWLVAPNNTIKVGDRAGYARPDGYRGLSIDGRLFLEHRLAWLYVYGAFPEGQLDHANGRHGDNRLSNLRPATSAQNQANGPVQKNNTSGHKGVSWHRKARKWYARIGIGGKIVHLGSFDTKEAAAIVYNEAAAKQFGEYARISSLTNPEGEK